MKNKHLMYKAASRLSNTPRFGHVKLDKPYNGAEHSFRVGILAMLIVDDYNVRNPSKKINAEEVMRKALIHDLEESQIGDIISPVKNRSPEFKSAYSTLAKEIMETEILQGSPTPEAYLKLWVEDKSGETGEVIKLADGLEALAAAYNELRRGNMSLKKAFTNIKLSLESPVNQELLNKFPYAKEFFNSHTNLPPQILALVNEVLDDDEF